MPSRLARLAALLTLAVGALLCGGCTTAMVAMHVHSLITEGDPTPCFKLNSVQRALEPRCAPFEPGSLKPQDLAAPQLPDCPLTLAARQPALWPVLPELIAKGASPEACRQPPWVALAQAQPCPDFAAAAPAQRQALRWLAEADARALHPDTVRVLSCPQARAAGLDGVLDGWRAQGLLDPGRVAFSPLDALHPSHLGSPLSQALEADGHTAAAALHGTGRGQLPGGFEQALRSADLVALDWWLQREPGLVNLVPSTHAGQLAWVPLARLLVPGFNAGEAQQRQAVEYLLAHGANPWRSLPYDSAQTPATVAAQLHSPLADMLARAPGPATPSALPIAAVLPLAPRQPH